jgi:hypothetical protein
MMPLSGIEQMKGIPKGYQVREASSGSEGQPVAVRFTQASTLDG